MAKPTYDELLALSELCQRREQGENVDKELQQLQQAQRQQPQQEPIRYVSWKREIIEGAKDIGEIILAVSMIDLLGGIGWF